MTVFKGYMKVIRQSRWLILMYVAIFFACTLLMQSAAGKTEKSFQAESLKIGIADEDGGTFAMALRTYLDNFHEVIPLENDISAMQEKLFYRDVEYIIRIPENFYQKCIVSGEKLPVTTVPDTYSGIYVDQQINSFLNNARTCQAAGFTEKEMADALVKDIPVKVELDTSMGSGETSRYIYYFRYVPYLALALLGFVIGNVLLVFRKKGLKHRMLASPVSSRRQALEGILCMIVTGTALFVLIILVALIWYGKELCANGNWGYLVMNTAALFFVAVSIAYFSGSLVTNKDALTGTMNIISLGMCFLCGVFVPLDYISTGVKNVSQFLPVYWYETANEILGEFTVLTGSAKIQIYQAVGIQLVFGVVFVCLTLVVEKYRSTGK